MPDRRAALTSPHIETLLAQVNSRFTLVTLSAKRARQINEYYHQLGEGLGRIVPPQVTSVSRKPLSIALEEIEEAKIEAVDAPLEGSEDEIDVTTDEGPALEVIDGDAATD